MSFTITCMRLKHQVDLSPAPELLQSDPASGGQSLQCHFYDAYGGAGDLTLGSSELREKSEALQKQLREVCRAALTVRSPQVEG